MTDEEFRDRFDAAITKLQMDDKDVARVLGVAWPTIGRWRSGESCPHPLGRESVFRALELLKKD